MGRDGKIDYQGDVKKAGVVLLSEVCGGVVSAQQSGAVQFLPSIFNAHLIKVFIGRDRANR